MDQMDGAAARVFTLLAEGPAALEPAGAGMSLLRNDKGAMPVAIEVLRKMARAGRIEMRGGFVVATPARKEGRTGRISGAFQSRRRDIAKIVLDDGKGAAEINLAESPLGQLMRRKGKDGRPFLGRAEFEAGERLRADYTRGQIMPRLGANWEASVASGRRGGGAADLTDAALAARHRVDRALKAVGPELSGLLVDVCCFLKGLETVESERAWPVRSAKIVLKTALGILARHYHPPSAEPRQQRPLHWGTEDFRPKNLV